MPQENPGAVGDTAQDEQEGDLVEERCVFFIFFKEVCCLVDSKDDP
ncbi:MAG: hypothetical protein JW771_01395 [Candidatus Thermoplasmatota archaeon]|nr:hypothetical protein [Candidatus Thermoplasmatota archaeon]